MRVFLFYTFSVLEAFFARMNSVAELPALLTPNQNPPFSHSSKDDDDVYYSSKERRERNEGFCSNYRDATKMSG